MSGSISRRNIQLDFSGDSEPLRAEDIPYDASASIKDKLDAIGSGSILSGTGAQWGYTQPIYNSSVLGSMGLLEDLTISGTTTRLRDADGLYFRISGAVGTVTTTEQMFWRQMNMRAGTRVKYTTFTNWEGYFFGWSNQSGSTMTSADNPPGHYAGVQYRSSRDTNFQLVSKDNSTQTVTDTGFVPTVNTIYHLVLELDDGAGEVRLNVLDGSGTSVATASHSTNLPATSTGMAFMEATRTVSGSQPNQTYYHFLETHAV